MGDIYYSPADFGLELIWQEDFGASYEFSIVAIWGSPATGAVYLGTDSGCSCPSPFEAFTAMDSVNELERLDPRNPDQTRAAINGAMGTALAYDNYTTEAERAAAVSAATVVSEWSKVAR